MHQGLARTATKPHAERPRGTAPPPRGAMQTASRREAAPRTSSRGIDRGGHRRSAGSTGTRAAPRRTPRPRSSTGRAPALYPGGSGSTPDAGSFTRVGLRSSSVRSRDAMASSPLDNRRPTRDVRAPCPEPPLEPIRFSSPARRCPTRNREHVGSNPTRRTGCSSPGTEYSSSHRSSRGDSRTGTGTPHKRMGIPKGLFTRVKTYSRSSRVRRTGPTPSLPSSQLSSTPGRLAA